MAVEMKKCPFCGGDGTLNHYPDDGYLPMCSKCDGMVEKWFKTEEEAIAAWNSRVEQEEARRQAAGRPVLDEDLRLTYYYLSLHRSMLENMRLGYMKRFTDSEGVLTNEKGKADRCQCDINTIDGYLERFREYALAAGQVTYLNPDYSRKLSLSFKTEDLRNGQ